MKVINRVKKYEEFQKVINEGSFLRLETLNVYFLKNDLPFTRFGISIPKKSGIAVIRNKMKRQIRAAIAKVCDYSLGYDIIVIARKEYDVECFEQVEDDIKKIIEKVGKN